MRLLTRRDRLRDDAPSSLLYRMATNLCLNRIRDTRRRKTTADSTLLEQIACLEDAEGRIDARAALAKLFGQQLESTRTMAVLYYVDGMTLEEVAREVGMSISGVRKRLLGPASVAARDGEIMNQQDERPISDYQLERYLLREGTDDELAALDRRLAADPKLAQRLAALERSNEEVHRRYPPEWMRGQIELKLKRAQGRRVQRTWSGYRLWAVPAVALILAVVAVPTLFDQETPEAPAPAGQGRRAGSAFAGLPQAGQRCGAPTGRGRGPKRGLGAARLPLRWLAVRGNSVRRWARCRHTAPTRDWSRGRVAGGARYPRRCLRTRRCAAVGAVLLGGGRPSLWPSSGQGQAGRWRCGVG